MTWQFWRWPARIRGLEGELRVANQDRAHLITALARTRVRLEASEQANLRRIEVMRLDVLADLDRMRRGMPTEGNEEA